MCMPSALISMSWYCCMCCLIPQAHRMPPCTLQSCAAARQAAGYARYANGAAAAHSAAACRREFLRMPQLMELAHPLSWHGAAPL
ncbi:hypothetical protein V8C86DRAFT_2775725 [Haematococcus lacustris]